MRSASRVLALALTFVACRSSESAKPRATGSVASASATAVPPAASVPAPASTIAKDRVEGMVTAWLRAQEQSNFDAYAALYAPLFTGVKRAGPRTTRFDRKGWLVDRREMFRKDTTVKVSDVRVFTGERTGFATFTQEWATARFRDVGTKRLDFVLEGGELLISREEMLFSATSAASGAKLPAPEEIALLWPLGKRFAAVLKRGKIATEGTPQRIPLPGDPLGYVLEKAPAAAELAALDAWRARTLDLYNAEGKACQAKVVSLRVLGGFIGLMEGTLEQLWQDLSDTYLVAMVEPSTPGCAAIWARAADLPPPKVLTRTVLSGKDADVAVAALEKTTTSVAVQAAYLEYRQRVAAMDAGPGSKAPEHWSALEPLERAVTDFTDRSPNVAYTVVELHAGEACGEFGGYALGFFKHAQPKWIDLTGDGSPASSFPERPLFGMAPRTAVRLDDGRLFMLGQDVIYGDAGFGFVPLLTIGAQRNTCSC